MDDPLCRQRAQTLREWHCECVASNISTATVIKFRGSTWALIFSKYRKDGMRVEHSKTETLTQITETDLAKTFCLVRATETGSN
jgi:hypothetical protein